MREHKLREYTKIKGVKAKEYRKEGDTDGSMI